MINSQKQVKSRYSRHRRRVIRRRKKIVEQPPYSLVWVLSQKSLAIKNTLILPGDCIIPLSTNSMRSIIEDLYIKSSCFRCQQYFELILSRKIRPFRDVQQLVLLLERINSPFIPKIKDLLLGGYRQYVDRTRQQRIESNLQNTARPLRKGLQNLPTCHLQSKVHGYLKNLSETFYRYELRVANQDSELQLYKIGFSEGLLELLYPEATDILLNNTPGLFNTLDSYIKYMRYSLEELTNHGLRCSKDRGNMDSQGQTEWVEIELETVDDIAISSTFKNLYYETAEEHVIITLFHIKEQSIDSIHRIRQEQVVKNVLTNVNPQAEKFFNKFYQAKEDIQPKAMCGYATIGEKGG